MDKAQVLISFECNKNQVKSLTSSVESLLKNAGVSLETLADEISEDKQGLDQLTKDLVATQKKLQIGTGIFITSVDGEILGKLEEIL